MGAASNRCLDSVEAPVSIEVAEVLKSRSVLSPGPAHFDPCLKIYLRAGQRGKVKVEQPAAHL
eukprot:1051687-Pleurochrysis_carterae.AAC.4